MNHATTTTTTTAVAAAAAVLMLALITAPAALGQSTYVNILEDFEDDAEGAAPATEGAIWTGTDATSTVQSTGNPIGGQSLKIDGTGVTSASYLTMVTSAAFNSMVVTISDDGEEYGAYFIVGDAGNIGTWLFRPNGGGYHNEVIQNGFTLGTCPGAYITVDVTAIDWDAETMAVDVYDDAGNLCFTTPSRTFATAGNTLVDHVLFGPYSGGVTWVDDIAFIESPLEETASGGMLFGDTGLFYLGDKAGMAERMNLTTSGLDALAGTLVVVLLALAGKKWFGREGAVVGVGAGLVNNLVFALYPLWSLFFIAVLAAMKLLRGSGGGVSD